VILSYAIWAFSVPIALSMLVILVLRLIVHKLPPRDMAASGWLRSGRSARVRSACCCWAPAAPHVFAAAGLPEIGQVAAGSA